MSESPDFALQIAVADVLKASAALKVLIGTPVRLYQNVPANPTFPYVTIGESQNVPDLADCIDGSEIFLTLHAFSRAGGFGEAKRIVALIETILHETSLTLTDHRCVDIMRDGNRVFFDSDFLTAHAVVTIRALVEATV